MRINKVEELVGITKKNIRFYEEQGLLAPSRNPENGYREYSEEDVLTLRKIKLLRQLSVPIEEILKLQNGYLTLEDSMRRHIITLEREEENVKQKAAMCMMLKDESAQYQNLDTGKYLEILEQKEKEGVHFMNIKHVDKKRKNGPIISAVIMIILMLSALALLVWGMFVDPIPLPLVLVFFLIPILVIVGILIALKQRMREIEGGEEDEASKY